MTHRRHRESKGQRNNDGFGGQFYLSLGVGKWVLQEAAALKAAAVTVMPWKKNLKNQINDVQRAESARTPKGRQGVDGRIFTHTHATTTAAALEPNDFVYSQYTCCFFSFNASISSSVLLF